MTTKKEKIIEILKKMRSNELVAVYNKYCIATDCSEACAHPMDKFNDFMKGKTALEIAEGASRFKHFYVFDDYFISTYQGIVSFNNVRETNEDLIKHIASYAVEHLYDFGNEKINRVLSWKEQDASQPVYTPTKSKELQINNFAWATYADGTQILYKTKFNYPSVEQTACAQINEYDCIYRIIPQEKCNVMDEGWITYSKKTSIDEIKQRCENFHLRSE